MAGSEKIVVKKTFLEVEEDVTPQGTRYSILWSAYMGLRMPMSRPVRPPVLEDSVVWARFTRQISNCSDTCEEAMALGPVSLVTIMSFPACSGAEGCAISGWSPGAYRGGAACE